MEHDFRQFIRAELETMARDLGEDVLIDVEQANRRAMEWIRQNAARFRDEWHQNHTQAETMQQGR